MFDFLPKWFKRDQHLAQDEMVKPYFDRANQALLGHDLGKAIAHLECGIRIAPGHLKLYLKRAQIFQYGLDDYSKALQDYRFIMRSLESDPGHDLVVQCRQGMRDMMSKEAIH